MINMLSVIDIVPSAVVMTQLRLFDATLRNRKYGFREECSPCPSTRLSSYIPCHK
jgi:hypothetical protein